METGSDELEVELAGAAGAGGLTAGGGVGTAGGEMYEDDGTGGGVVEIVDWTRLVEAGGRPVEDDFTGDVAAADEEGTPAPAGGEPNPVHIEGKGSVTD